MGYTLLEWDEHYSVGFELFDNQHKRLIEMINELYEAFITGDVQNKTIDIVSRMVDYANYHFKSEETFFERYGYPENENHKAGHESFAEKVTEFKNGINSGNATVSYDIMNYLTEWLKHHIMGEDKKYIEFFKSVKAEITE